MATEQCRYCGTEIVQFGVGWVSAAKTEAPRNCKGMGREHEPIGVVSERSIEDAHQYAQYRVSQVWERTLDEYEKSILNGNARGAAILRALLLENLKTKQPTVPDCAFCGKRTTECECPHPM